VSRLGSIDRVLGILSWVVAAALVVMLFVGPVLVADDEPATGSPPPAADGGASGADGEAVFVDNCGTCHTLETAGTSGTVGPSLDDVGLDAEEISTIVSDGRGGMPSFSGDLDPAEIDAVAEFVAGSAPPE
jgi:mono/diheme cytochrome c family protein